MFRQKNKFASAIIVLTVMLTVYMVFHVIKHTDIYIVYRINIGNFIIIALMVVTIVFLCIKGSMYGRKR